MLSYDVVVIQLIMTCHKNRMTARRVVTFLRAHVTSLTTSKHPKEVSCLKRQSFLLKVRAFHLGVHPIEKLNYMYSFNSILLKVKCLANFEMFIIISVIKGTQMIILLKIAKIKSCSFKSHVIY